MAIGDKVVDDGVEFEVVWDGTRDLIGDRPSRASDSWEPPKRIYIKKSDYWKGKDTRIINPLNDEEIDNAPVLRNRPKDPDVELDG